ncbi:MAG: hypothetical protein FIA82_05015 [Melioribacter sp.]|nr:hypothetical protein [Melioribacter sp.]
MKKRIEIEIKKILNDKTSGSNDLLADINSLLLHNTINLSELKLIIKKLKKGLPTFTNIQNYLDGLEKKIRSKDSAGKFFLSFNQTEKNIYDSIFKNIFTYLSNKKNILTISNSKTVFEILYRLNSVNKLSVFICESRPGNEGRLLAEKLADKKIKTQLITEAQIARYLEKCDCILTGADSILKNGDVINKVGSLQLAVLGKYYGKPFYVIADKLKLSSNNKFIQTEEPRKEIWNTHTKKIRVENFYFERIPKLLISKIITN